MLLLRYIENQRLTLSATDTRSRCQVVRTVVRLLSGQNESGLLKMGLSWPLLGFVFPLTLYIVKIQLIHFKMVNDNRKQERRR